MFSQVCVHLHVATCSDLKDLVNELALFKD